MAAVATQLIAVPVGVIKQFGPYGPEYEIVSAAPMEDGMQMVNIVIVRTGETLTYPLLDALQDQEAL
ncbi:MAG TPA: DUF5397 family protein [Acidobacteriaceae bacterium]|nr:DUF5397 family protein [Acidobacteriaceae bacterium]